MLRVLLLGLAIGAARSYRPADMPRIGSRCRRHSSTEQPAQLFLQPLLHLRGGARRPKEVPLPAHESREAGGKAAAADALQEMPEAQPAPPPTPALSKSIRVTINLFLWWSLNVLFALANKECLNSWNHPWALACMHLAIGSACMLPLYAKLPHRAPDSREVRWKSVRARPTLTIADLREMLPVVALLATGHVTSTLAPAYGTVAFSNIVKTVRTCLRGP